MSFFNTFRGRLSLVLGVLLIATVGVQYYLNLRIQAENINLTEMQEQALLAGFAIGVNSMTSQDRLRDFVGREGQSFYNERTSKRIRDILVIDNDWQVYDSLSGKYLPVENVEGEYVSKDLRQLTDLPPLMEKEEKLGEDIRNFPNAGAPDDSHADGEAHAIPVETNQGRFYVMIILNSDKGAAAARAAQPLIFTIGIFLVSIIVTILLVWRFTTPIANLSRAARKVGRGDLSYRVPDTGRTDEVGSLTKQFNLMTEELEKSKVLEEQLQEAEKSAVVGRLASAIAHEIRNPLNYINLTLDHLRKKFKPEDAGRSETFEKLTVQLKSEVERINRQVSDFLRYTRPVKIDFVPVDVRSVIENSLKIVEPQAEESGIQINIVERDDAPAVAGDADVLRSVFNNLFLNSIHAMEQTGGKLSILITREEGVVKVAIRDTGPGVPEEHAEKVFQPYFSTKETGTGLGLAIVKRIIDEHGGSIELESPDDGGACFVITLPAAVSKCPQCGGEFMDKDVCPDDGAALVSAGASSTSSDRQSADKNTEI